MESEQESELFARVTAIDRDLKYALLELTGLNDATSSSGGKSSGARTSDARTVVERFWDSRVGVDVGAENINVGRSLEVLGYSINGFVAYKTEASGPRFPVVPAFTAGHTGRHAPLRPLQFAISPTLPGASLGGAAFCGNVSNKNA